MATIKEIAAELGISPMTVSNVLNNKKHKVSEKTYQRVMALVQKEVISLTPMRARSVVVLRESLLCGFLLLNRKAS